MDFYQKIERARRMGLRSTHSTKYNDAATLPLLNHHQLLATALVDWCESNEGVLVLSMLEANRHAIYFGGDTQPEDGIIDDYLLDGQGPAILRRGADVTWIHGKEPIPRGQRIPAEPEKLIRQLPNNKELAREITTRTALLAWIHLEVNKIVTSIIGE